MPALTVERAREFLTAKRIAVVGVSRGERDFSRAIFRELVARGYDVVPVNPGAEQVEGRRCFPRLQNVRPAADAALLLTSREQTDAVLRDCVEAGIRRVWLHRGAGVGAASPGALAFCAANGLEVVHDLCPFMALPGAGFPHRVHRFFRTAGARRA